MTWLDHLAHEFLQSLTRPWDLFGHIGNVVFFGRFLVQWIVSERLGRSVVPKVFWYMSLVGSAILVVYWIHESKAVGIVGQSAGFLVYTRNLMLIARQKSKSASV